MLYSTEKQLIDQPDMVIEEPLEELCFVMRLGGSLGLPEFEFNECYYS